MNPHQRHALLLELIDRLNQQGSWCGPKSLQKAVYLLEQLLQAPTGLDFVMYKFAPFSFDLEYQVTAMRAYYLLELHIRRDFFGPILWPRELSKTFRDRYPVTLKTYDHHLTFVCCYLDKKRMNELERITSALFVTHKLGENASIEERAKRIEELHPHVRPMDALAAVEEIDRLAAEAKHLTMDTTAA